MANHCHGSEDVVIAAGETLVSWCPACGSIYDNNGDHGAEAGTWRAPTAIVLPGWRCGHCRGFNGSAKELLTECRCCGTPRRRT